MTSGSFIPIPDDPPLMFTSLLSIILFITPFLYKKYSKSSTDVFSSLSCSSYVQHSWEELKEKQKHSHTAFALPTMIIHMDYSQLPEWGRETERERDVEDVQ